MQNMTELEKLDAGLEYDMWDEAVGARKRRALALCFRLEQTDPTDGEKRLPILRELFGSLGDRPTVYPGFHCDDGKNIHAGDALLVNFNVCILDRAPVRMGNNVMIGPGSLLTTVGHPLSPKGRRGHLSQAKPITIGDDVWIGGNVTVLPGVTIGSNVVVAAGAVVNRDLPADGLYGGIPARKLRDLENDIEK